jgi:hypothetical protein
MVSSKLRLMAKGLPSEGACVLELRILSVSAT